MATLQICIDDTLKKGRCIIFQSWVRHIDSGTYFLNASIENNGIPFSVQHKVTSNSLEEAVYDSRFRRNLNGSFDSAEDAVASMLED